MILTQNKKYHDPLNVKDLDTPQISAEETQDKVF